MNDIALEFDGVWKKFKRGEIHDSLRDLVPAITREMLARKTEMALEDKEFWALRDVSFQIRQGEAFGIIGNNGAGKSTTLKLLSRILRPNRGRIVARGRMSALIEVGAGFHPDLTGRENVYLNGAILGMKRHEIARKFDAIVDFAGIGEFMDTPVKRYSSGMYARLGFAVAAHVDPEILLVDEVLSVGDMRFQEKCFDRMRAVVRDGTTVIFVSHNLQAVQMLCHRSLLLKRGQVAKIGPTPDVLHEYVCTPSAVESSQSSTVIHGVMLYSADDRSRTSFSPGERVQLELSVQSRERLEDCQLGLLIHRATDGLPVCDYNLSLSEAGSLLPGASGNVPLQVDLKMNLLRGAYVLSLHIYHMPTGTHLCRADKLMTFFVEETTSWQGVAHVNPLVRAGSACQA